MRDFNAAAECTLVVLEHYPEMTQNTCNRLHKRLWITWNILDIILLHRSGQVFPKEIPMFMYRHMGEHRADAYAANRFIMEDLKSKSPIWKKESLGDQERWLTGSESEAR